MNTAIACIVCCVMLSIALELAQRSIRRALLTPRDLVLHALSRVAQGEQSDVVYAELRAMGRQRGIEREVTELWEFYELSLLVRGDDDA